MWGVSTGRMRDKCISLVNKCHNRPTATVTATAEVGHCVCIGSLHAYFRQTPQSTPSARDLATFAMRTSSGQLFKF